MSQPVRLGLIGAGRWGQVYLRTIASLSERCRLTHLGTTKPERAALLPYPVHVETDWRRVVDANCDAIIIATPAQTHAEIVEACLSAGKPCLVEKPFCTDLETAQRLHEHAASSGALVLVDHTQLFHPAYQALKQRLRAAREPVRAVVAERMGTDRPWSDTPVLWEWGPHDASLCLDLFGQMPQQVEALGGPAVAGSGPAVAMLRLEFADGACAWIHIGWFSPEKRRRVSVLTDRTLYVCDDLAAEKLTVSAWGPSGAQGPASPVTLPPQPVMAAMLAYFLEGVSGGDRRHFGTQLALDVTRLLDQCEAALRSHQVTP